MRNNEKKNRRKRPGGDSLEMRVVGIDFKPAPDAEERLRRLFTILVSHFAGEGAGEPEQDFPSAGSPSDDDSEPGC